MAKTVVSKTNKTLEKMGEVVNKVISLIEEKNLLPWEQGFVPGVIVGGRLINHLTKRPYSGSNLMTLLWLSIASIGEDFAGEYMTAAAAKGAYGPDTFPKKGSKAIPIFFPCFFNEKEKRYWKNGDEEADKKFVGMRYWNVFPIESFAKFDSGEIVAQEKRAMRRDVATNEEIESFISQFAKSTNLTLKRPSHALTACYRPSFHEVQVSQIGFYATNEQYYSTFFHELTHSTAKAMRRKTGTKFETELYSAKELVAEFGALLLCEYFGITKESGIQNSATYIDGWKKYLADNPQVLITGINAAFRAVNYMLEKGGLPKLYENENNEDVVVQSEEAQEKKIA